MPGTKIIFINSHPIQYFAPLYQFMHERGIPVSAWYCSDENVKGHLDRQFNAHVAWDIPLLDGYPSVFFRNASWKPTIYGRFFGLINPGLLSALFKEQKCTVVIHGWAYFSMAAAVIAARLRGHTVCLRGESSFRQEIAKGSANKWFKRIFLQGFLFRFVNFFLFIGKENRAFYKSLGVPDKKLAFAPYAVDNRRFRNSAIALRADRSEIRKSMNITLDARVILFTAKFIKKKRPLDLMEAFRRSEVANKFLVMVGDGELKKEMQEFIASNSLANIHLTGFINQSEIVRYYTMADIFVMCSEAGETWGLSVNEALNFNLPVVVSDVTGCSADLVEQGRNGYIFKTGDIDDLTEKISKGLALGFPNSTDVMGKYSYEVITETIRSI